MNNNENIIIASYITGIFDVNRNETLPNGQITPIIPWIESIIKNNLQAVVFYNSINPALCEVYSNNITFIQIEPLAAYGTNVMRYFFYQKFIEVYKEINNFFITDITDVLVLKNPFLEECFTNNKGKIFCGDEPTTLSNPWMKNHNDSFRNRITSFHLFEEMFKNETLLNCGIVGGNRQVMQRFLNSLCDIHSQYNQDNTSAYTGDMGAFNYVIRTHFNDNVVFGAPVNTVFKNYDTENHECWFSHK